MDENALRGLISSVKDGKLSRRAFVKKMVALGLTAPMAAQMLSFSGVPVAAATPDKFTYKPTKRGGGGRLKVLWWQGATLLNPHFASGIKDQDGSRIFYEPLAALGRGRQSHADPRRRDSDRDKRRRAADGRSVTWKLKRDVQWHDGKPFTADDVVFNWEYASGSRRPRPSPSAPTRTSRSRRSTTHAVEGAVRQADAVLGRRVRRHARACSSRSICLRTTAAPKSREAPANLKPVGTGPYKFVDFMPGDMVRGEINTDYHMPNRPHFDTIEMKGGGDAVSAARAVLQTGEFDYAWNLQVEDEILMRLENGGKGEALSSTRRNIEHIQLNSSDPWTEVDGERANPKTRHPLLATPRSAQAMA